MIFRLFRKIAKINYQPHHVRPSVLPSVRRSVHMELGTHWNDYRETLYLIIFRKPIEQLQDSFQSDNNNGTLHADRYIAGLRPATSSVHYTTSCNTQSSAPEDG